MEFYHLSDLRNAANAYLSLDFRHANKKNDDVVRLHNAINKVQLGEISKILERFNVNQTRVIEDTILPLRNIIRNLMNHIGNHMHQLKKNVDSDVGKVFEFCQKFQPLIDEEYEKLNSRRNTDPTKDDCDAWEKFKLFLLGDYGEMTLDDFIKEYTIKGLSPDAVARRLNYLIGKCTDEQTKREIGKYLYWQKCNKDVIKELHNAFTDFYRYFDHAANISPIPPEGNRDVVVTRLYSVLEWCSQHPQDFKHKLVSSPLLKDINDLGTLANYICTSVDNWISIIGDDVLAIQLINEVCTLLNTIIEPTIMERKQNLRVPEPQPLPAVQMVKDHKQTKKNGIQITIDEERLKSCFNAVFKGAGQNYNHFDDLIQDIKNIKQTKQIGMVAVMIYNCGNFIHRPPTFTAWLREFCEICGVDCPKDTSMNKYKPNDNFKRTFYYLK